MKTKTKTPAGGPGPDSDAGLSAGSVANSPSVAVEKKVSVLDAALDYVERGWSVFPVHGIDDGGNCSCGKAGCHNAGKHPATPHGLNDATTNIGTIRSWFSGKKPRNIGVRTGQASGITVLDIDVGEKDGAETWTALNKDEGEPKTLKAQTGSGGWHVFFKYNSALSNTSNALGPGVDCRNDGGYIVAPPSRHRSGGKYKWQTKVDLADLPRHLTRKRPEPRQNHEGVLLRKRTGDCPFDLETIKDALSHVPADDRDDWRHISIILGREFGCSEPAWKLYKEWADKWDGDKDSNHDEIMRECFYEKSKEHSEPELTWRTILHLAREQGWKPPQTKPESKFKLIPFGELEPRPLDWLIEGLIERDSLAVLFGDPGAAKTFWALDMAFCVASGKPHHDRKVKAGLVVYVAGEGHNGLARRRKAWEILNEIDLKESPIYVSEGPAMLTDVVNLSTVLTAIDEVVEESGQVPQLIVIDTLARNFGPGDENSTQDMTKFVRACDELRIGNGCAVILVHHTGHADKSRQRGSTVMNGAIDVSYRLKKDDQGVITVDHGKQPKDFLPVEPFAFKFRTVELGFENEDGTPATSAVLDPVEVPLSSHDSASSKLGKNQRAGLSVLMKLLSEREGDVLVSEWRDSCCEMNSHQFNDIKRSLAYRKYIFIDGDKISQASSQPRTDFF